MTTPSTASPRERANAWLEPISAEAPCGAPSKHDPAYESVFSEVAKLESPTGDGVRWDEVVRGAGELLRKTTKDLWLASYLAYALYMTEGLPGAITGATLLSELTERYWQGLFPEASRLRSRGLALSWYVERMKHVFPTVQAESTSPAVVEALSDAVSKLAEVSRSRLAAQGPALGPLLTSLERLRASMPKETPAPTPAPTPPAAPAAPVETPAVASASPAPVAPPPAPVTPAPAPPPTAQAPAASAAAVAALASQLPAAPTGELFSSEAAADYLRNIGSSLASASGVLRRASPADPLSYRLLRTGLWLHISQSPPTGANGRTSLPPLPAALRTKLETLTANSRWLELIDEAESALTQYRFALDLQRFSAHALASLGPAHAPAREALLLELGTLLKRMPAVVELVASDGSALADKATQEWLKREVLAKPTAAPRPVAAAPLSRELDTPAVGDFPEGESLEQLRARLATATTARARFVARLHLARLCAQSGQPTTARALYEELDAECTARSLDSWEPALAAACLEGFLTCVTAVKDSHDGLVGDDWIRYRRLAQLDPAAALRVQP